MNIQCQKEDLLKAVLKASSVTEKKTTMPILGNLLFEVKENELHIYGTDLEITVQASLNIQADEKGKLCTPASQFSEITKQLPEDEVTLKRDENGWLDIRSGKAHFRVATVDAEEFPEMPRKEDYQFQKLAVSTLNDGFSHTFYAMSTDEMRPNLNGVLMEMNAERQEIKMVATDGHRLAMYKTQPSSNDTLNLDKKVILPRKGIGEVKKILSETSQDSVSVSVSPANAVFESDGVVVFMKLVVGDYPDYAKVIPTGDRRKLRLNRQAFGQALKRVSLLSEGKSKCVRLNISNNHVLLKANSPEMGEAEEEVGAEFTGEDLQIGFNAKYLLDALSVMKDDSMVIELDHEQSPGIVQGPEADTYLSVIMPMRI